MSKNENLDYNILKELDNNTPLGAVRLSMLLTGMGQATIGRKLLEFDYKGLTKKAGGQGRILTCKGKEYLSRLETGIDLRREQEILSEILQKQQPEKIMEVLEVRYILEPQVAFLAAKRADPEMISAMNDVLVKQGEEIDKGRTGQMEDQEFHDLIAKASGNSVLCSVLRVLRTENQILSYLSLIRKKVGGKLLLDHRNIFQAIKDQDSFEAEKAMKRHINEVIRDVEKYLK